LGGSREREMDRVTVTDRIIVASRMPFLLGLLFLILILLVAVPLYATRGDVLVLTRVLMFIILAVSWVIFSGPTRYISLATAAFFGIGIYTSILVGTLPLPVVIGIGGLASFCLALLVGLVTLRLRGVYFVIFTFGLIQVIRHLVLWWEVNITGTVGRSVATVDHTTVYYSMLGILVIAMLTAYFIRRSRYGLALLSIGECEEAAAHIGINVTLLKVMAFAISAFFMGAVGTAMAARWIFIDPDIAFSPILSFMPVVMAIFGGMGQLWGPVIGAVILSYLEVFLITRFPHLFMLLFGIILVVAILYLPDGLVGLIQKLWKRSQGLIQKLWERSQGEQHADT